MSSEANRRLHFWNVRPLLPYLRTSAALLPSSPERDRLVAMLLETTDLPGHGWKLLNQIAYKTGGRRPQTPEGRRARNNGSITVKRSFRNEAVNRWLSLFIVPFASEADAIAYVPNAVARMTRIYSSKVVASHKHAGIEASKVDGPLIADFPTAMLWEMRRATVGERYVVGAIENMMVFVHAQAPDDMPPWDELTAVAELQVAKLHRSLSEH